MSRLSLVRTASAEAETSEVVERDDFWSREASARITHHRWQKNTENSALDGVRVVIVSRKLKNMD